MANILKLLDLLKWHTDESHPLTQEKLRTIPGAHESMGYKATFKRQLLALANTYNENKEETNWRIVFPGYRHKDSNDEKYHTGPIFYRHSVTKEVLRFIILQLHGISFEAKAKLILKLVREVGSKNLFEKPLPDYIDIDKIDDLDLSSEEIVSEIKDIIQTTEFPTPISDDLQSNLNIIADAIMRKKLLSFTPSYVDRNGNVQLILPLCQYQVSPYHIVYHRGYYWLIGNRRLNTFIYEGRQYNHYANTLDIFRIDKLLNLSIACNEYELRAKTTFEAIDLNKCIDILSSRLHAYRDGESIVGSDITEDYGMIEFEISSNTVEDYAFIFDTFGKNITITHKDSKTVFCVHASENCFIEWVLPHIDKIRILNTSPQANSIINSIKTILETGLKNLEIIEQL